MAPDAVLTKFEPQIARPAHDTRFTIQLGAFSQRENAEKLAQRARLLGEARIEEAVSSGRRLHRVQIGDYASRSGAEHALAWALNAGLSGAIIAVIR